MGNEILNLKKNYMYSFGGNERKCFWNYRALQKATCLIG